MLSLRLSDCTFYTGYMPCGAGERAREAHKTLTLNALPPMGEGRMPQGAQRLALGGTQLQTVLANNMAGEE
jgi:hypothetical protein